MDYRKRIEDFYEGKLSAEQVREFLEWLESSEAEELLSAEIIQEWNSQLKAQESNWDSSQLWERINREKSGFSAPFVHREKIESRKSPLRAWLKYAAAFVLLAVSYFVWNSIRSEQELSETSLALNEAGPKMVTKANPAGQKTKILLSDGSTIYLNSESSVTYPENFLTNRQVTLEGEAFFEVAKDAAHPFSVEAKGITTTALGTSFNISTFNRQDKVAVTLLTGKVKVHQLGKADDLELLPGEESVLAVDEARPNKYPVNTRDRVLWMMGVLKFENTAFADMTQILERWYGVKIQVTGNPSRDLATGTFDNNESLKNVLNVLGGTLGFHYEINEKDVFIHFN